MDYRKTLGHSETMSQTKCESARLIIIFKIRRGDCKLNWATVVDLLDN